LWWRQGFTRLGTNPAIPLLVNWDMFLSTFVEGSVHEFLVSRYAVIEISSSGSYSIPYNATTTENVAFTTGSTTITASATNWVLGDVGDDPLSGNFYIITGGAGTLNGTIDRPAAATGTASTKRYAQLSSVDVMDACFLKNDVTHAGAAVWGTS